MKVLWLCWYHRIRLIQAPTKTTTITRHSGSATCRVLMKCQQHHRRPIYRTPRRPLIWRRRPISLVTRSSATCSTLTSDLRVFTLLSCRRRRHVARRPSRDSTQTSSCHILQSRRRGSCFTNHRTKTTLHWRMTAASGRHVSPRVQSLKSRCIMRLRAFVSR